MKQMPHRQDHVRAMEDGYNKELLEYYQQFPYHPCAGAWLAANKIEGVECRAIEGIEGGVLVGYPVDDMKPPDFDSWTAEQDKFAQEAEKIRQAKLEQMNADQAVVDKAILAAENGDMKALESREYKLAAARVARYMIN